MKRGTRLPTTVASKLQQQEAHNWVENIEEDGEEEQGNRRMHPLLGNEIEQVELWTKWAKWGIVEIANRHTGSRIIVAVDPHTPPSLPPTPEPTEQ